MRWSELVMGEIFERSPSRRCFFLVASVDFLEIMSRWRGDNWDDRWALVMARREVAAVIVVLRCKTSEVVSCRWRFFGVIALPGGLVELDFDEDLEHSSWW